MLPHGPPGEAGYCELCTAGIAIGADADGMRRGSEDIAAAVLGGSAAAADCLRLLARPEERCAPALLRRLCKLRARASP